MASAVEFILNHRSLNGGWCENRALKLPPERTWLGNERSITWFTADIVELLCQVGMGESGICQSALEWLRTMENQRGSWPSLAGNGGGGPGDTGDPDAIAQVTFLMGEVYGEGDPVYLKGRELFEHCLDECVQAVERGYWIKSHDGKREPLEVYILTHLLLSWLLDPPRRLQSGYNVSDPRARRMMKTLVGVQREDGGGRSFRVAESSPAYTVLAVKVLVLSRMLVRENLEANVKVHAV